MPSIYDVARLAGVSPATVSRAFARPGRVHEETLARIHAAAEQLGYRSRTVSQQPDHPLTRQLALLVTDCTNPYFMEIIRGAVTAAGESDFSITLIDTQESISLEETSLERVVPQVDGVILAAARIPDGPIRAAARERPIVLLNRALPEAASISNDIRSGVREAMAHLAALGHRSVAYVAGPESSFADDARRRAVRDSAARHGLHVRFLGPVSPNLNGGEVAARALVGDGVTAALCYNDLVALGLMRELRRMGFEIPRDVSIIGVDNIMSGQLVTPPLTSIAAPYAALGSVAVHTLISLIAGSRDPGRESTLLPMRLIVRGSTTAPVAS